MTAVPDKHGDPTAYIEATATILLVRRTVDASVFRLEPTIDLTSSITVIFIFQPRLLYL